MAERRPLVVIAGVVQELPAGDTTAGATGGGGGVSADVAGTVILDFGAAPGGNVATATVYGQTSMGANAQIDAWLMGVDSEDHNAYEHMMAPITVRAGMITPGSSFQIMGTSPIQLTGRFAVQWVRTQ